MTTLLAVIALCAAAVVAAPNDSRQKGIVLNPENAAARAQRSYSPELSFLSSINHPDCGIRSVLSDNGKSEITGVTRIVGGFAAKANSWPFICSLRSSRSPYSHFCGANLVRSKEPAPSGKWFLITAAHCVNSNNKASAYVARCGISDRKDKTEGLELKFSKLWIHEEYDPSTVDNDIAIFEISTPITPNDKISPVCLPTQGWFDMEPSIAAGWGVKNSGAWYLPVMLRQVFKYIKPRTYCSSKYGKNSITDSMLCAGLSGGGADSCQGDSGGPLYTFIDEKWVLTGVTSWGIGCGEANYPGVYADVEYLKPWIHNIINFQ